MSLKKFGPKDIITNTMRTHPSCEFFIFDGKVYYNNIPYVSGAISRGANVPVSSGYASLYEMNVDRLSASAEVAAGGLSGGRWIGGTSEPNEAVPYNLKIGWLAGPGATPSNPSTTQYRYSSKDTLVAWWPLTNGKTISEDGKASDKQSGFDGSCTTDGDNDAATAGNCPAGSPGVAPSKQLAKTNASIQFVAAEFDSLSVADADPLTFGSSGFAIAAWIYPIATNGSTGNADGSEKHRVVVHKGTKSITNMEYHLALETAGTRDGTGKYKLRFRIGSSSGHYMGRITDDYEINEKEWTHVVVTHDGSNTVGNMKFYINGTEITDLTNETAGTYTAPMQNTSEKLYIGVRKGASSSGKFGRFFNGNMSNISMWNEELSSDTVSALFSALGGVYKSFGGFVHSDIVDNGLIYPFVTKDGTRVSLRSIYTGSTYDLDFQYGDIVSSSYPLSASITREMIGWYPANEGAYTTTLPAIGPYGADAAGGSRGAGQLDTGNASIIPTSEEESTTSEGTSTQACGNRQPLTVNNSAVDTAGGSLGWDLNPNDGFGDNIVCNSPKWPHYWALKNTLKDYGYLSEHYKVTSSYGIKDQQIINLISIPSIFYGSKIKPGTVSLKWYLTGTLIAELRDTKQNGELIEITTSNPYIEQYGADNVAGVVLYNHGFILLTGSWALNETTGRNPGDAKSYTCGQISIRSGSGGTQYAPMWIDWGAGSNDNCNKLTTSTSGSATPSTINTSNNFESASFGLSFKGTSETQTLTMFAHAKRGEINYSNNPTFLIHTQSATSSFYTSSQAYVEDPNRLVFNFVSSSYPDYSASFKRQVYVSKVALYDENKNLIGVATMSNPVRKEEGQDLTFKLKLDI
jgi:hypothetical protein